MKRHWISLACLAVILSLGGPAAYAGIDCRSDRLHARITVCRTSGGELKCFRCPKSTRRAGLANCAEVKCPPIKWDAAF
jgi:hypothetical protein